MCGGAPGGAPLLGAQALRLSIIWVALPAAREYSTTAMPEAAARRAWKSSSARR